jgi:hypothetical protein
MALVLADRVYETSTTTGTSTFDLGGAASGFQTFITGAGDGAQVPYVIDDGTDWEVGIGTVTSGSPDTLSRDTILKSTNTNAAVNWGAGTKNVRLYPGADLFATLRTENTWQEQQIFTGNVKFQGKVQFADDGELTISSGAITPTGVFHTVDTESDASSDDLETISGGVDGDILRIRAANTARTIVIKDGTGNIEIPSGNDVSLEDDETIAVFKYDGEKSKWLFTSFDSGDYYTKSETDSAISTATSSLPFSSEYTSTQQTITVAGSLTLAHGFGSRPKIIQGELVCITADLGYSPGDIVDIGDGLTYFGTGSNGCVFYSDSTNIYVRYGGSSGPFILLTKNTGVASTTTPANWRLVVKAWA